MPAALRPPPCALLLLLGWGCSREQPQAPPAAAHGAGRPIELVGKASIPGDARDQSGLAGTLVDGTPLALLGSFGSAIAWTGSGTRYIAACDRGPSNGATLFPDRLQTFDIAVTGAGLAIDLIRTTLLVDPDGRSYVGDLHAFDAERPERGLRLDPEGIRAGPRGTYFVSDEYGPWLLEFAHDGRCLRRLPVPAEYAVAHPAADDEEHVAGNTRGRLSNRGFEGLAISPDGTRLYALPQSPLIQDHGREGTLCRMLELEIASGKTREWAVPLASPELAFGELLAIDARRFLAIERDSASGNAARIKRILELDLDGASDVSSIAALPPNTAANGFACVGRRTFLDLLDQELALAGDAFPEKVEGLCFGPDLPDGRHLLLVTTDNDLRAGTLTWIWALAIAPAALPGLVPQHFEVTR